MRFLEAAHVKDLVCAFRLADNPSDPRPAGSFTPPARRGRAGTARRVIAALGVPGDPAPLEHCACRTDPSRAGATRCGRASLPGYVPCRTSRQACKPAAPRRDDRPWIAARYADAAARLADLDQLVATAAKPADSATSLPSSCSKRRQQRVTSPVSAIDDDYLVISTAHSAKGLEWDSVHVLHAADGNFPPTCPCRPRRASRRSCGCSTSRSPGHGGSFRCTRRCATTTARGAGRHSQSRPAVPLPHPGRTSRVRRRPRRTHAISGTAGAAAASAKLVDAALHDLLR